MKHWFGSKVVTLAAALTLSLPCAAAQFPSQPVRLIVAYVPGGATDLIARTLGAALGRMWNQQVVVENRPGAGGMIGAQQVVHAGPDGYTLLLGYTPEVSINKLIYKKMQYDPQTDLTPISLVAEAPLVLAAGSKLPVKRFAELLQQAKSLGRPISFGSPGTGGQQHLAGELLHLRTGLDMLHVPYRGTGAAVADLVGGQIDVFFATTPPLLGQIRAGKLHPLLVTGPDRQPLLPDVPTVDELGLKEFHLTNWFGLLGPAGMDAALVDRIAADVATALKSPDTAKTLQDSGLTLRYLAPGPFKDFIAGEMKLYDRIIDSIGLEKQ